LISGDLLKSGGVMPYCKIERHAYPHNVGKSRKDLEVRTPHLSIS